MHPQCGQFGSGTLNQIFIRGFFTQIKFSEIIKTISW